MATACLFIGFSRPVPGREAEAYRLLSGEALARIDAFQKEGWFDSYQVIGLTPHMGTVNSFILLEGRRDKLDELRRTDTFERFSLGLARLFDGYGVIPGVTLEGLRSVMARNPELSA